MPGVVIPYVETSIDRHAALQWVLQKYHDEHPDYRVIVERGEQAGLFCKAELVNRGIQKCRVSDDPVIVADADVWSDGMPSAVRAVTCGAAEWAMPHGRVFRLTRESTAEVLEGRDWHGLRSSRPYTGLAGGGIVVACRETFEAIPMDPRFVGWGQEDEAWGFALRVLAGAPWRADDDLVHLWHPSPPRVDRRVGNFDGYRLMKRYGRIAKAADPERMKELLAECQ